MFKNAVVGIDGEHGGRDAVTLARQLGAPGGRITLAHIYGVGLVLHGSWHHLLSSQREVALERLERERDAASVDAPVVAFVDRSVGRGLHRLAGPKRPICSWSVRVGGACSAGFCLAATRASRSTVRRVRSRSRQWGTPRGLTRSPRSASATTARRRASVRSPPPGNSLVSMGQGFKVRSVVSLYSVPYGEPIPENWPDAARQVMDYERGRTVRSGGCRGRCQVRRAERGARTVQ